ncbi:hypothetical protein CR513_52657, partial [Mucuna pruriens]
MTRAGIAGVESASACRDGSGRMGVGWSRRHPVWDGSIFFQNNRLHPTRKESACEASMQSRLGRDDSVSALASQDAFSLEFFGKALLPNWESKIQCFDNIINDLHAKAGSVLTTLSTFEDTFNVTINTIVTNARGKDEIEDKDEINRERTHDDDLKDACNQQDVENHTRELTHILKEKDISPWKPFVDELSNTKDYFMKWIEMPNYSHKPVEVYMENADK